MIHPATKLSFISDAIGYGVVATDLIPRGTIVWVRDELDQTLTEEQLAGLGPLFGESLGKYLYVDTAGLYVLCWDISRYINHSCESTCLPAGLAYPDAGLPDFEVALRDIQPGEQLTDDYGTLEMQFRFECRCGAPSCRGVVDAADHPRCLPRWQERTREAFSAIRDVPQALWPLLPETEGIEELLGRGRPFHAFQGQQPAPEV